jgi:hypothetical protein
MFDYKDLPKPQATMPSEAVWVLLFMAVLGWAIVLLLL